MEILDIIQSKAQDMDTASLLKQAGIGTEKIVTSWSDDRGSNKKELGSFQNIPRQ